MRTRKQPAELRRHLYISATKVDDLAGQIPPSVWKRLEPSIGFNFILQGSVSLRANQSARGPVLETIEEQLEKGGYIGTLEEPESVAYVRGSLKMRWGVWSGARVPLVWFIGADDTTLLAMGGRKRHLISVYEDEVGLGEGEKEAPSETAFAEGLAAHLRESDDAGHLAESDDDSRESWINDLLLLERHWPGEHEEHVDFIVEIERGPERVPGRGQSGADVKSVILGSPLWVARPLKSRKSSAGG